MKLKYEYTTGRVRTFKEEADSSKEYSQRGAIFQRKKERRKKEGEVEGERNGEERERERGGER